MDFPNMHTPVTGAKTKTQNISACQKPLKAPPSHQPSPDFQHHTLVFEICVNVIVCVLFCSIFFCKIHSYWCVEQVLPSYAHNVYLLNY